MRTNAAWSRLSGPSASSSRVSLAGLLLLFIVKGPAKELVTGIILKIINLVSGWGLKG